MHWFGARRIVSILPSCAARHGVGRGAFSLVELLVVIGVISVLAALFMPTLESALEQSRIAVCAGNMRQFGIAFSQFLESNKGIFPNKHSLAPYGNAMVNYRSFRDEFLPDTGLMICPTMPARTFFSYEYNLDPNNRRNLGGNNYYYQWHVLGTGDRAPFGTYYYYGGSKEETNNASFRVWSSGQGFTMRLTHVKNPSAYAPVFDWDVWRVCNTTVPFYADTAQRYAQNPHSLLPGRTYAYMDGHSRFMHDPSMLLVNSQSDGTPLMSDAYCLDWRKSRFYAYTNPRPSTSAELSGILGLPER